MTRKELSQNGWLLYKENIVAPGYKGILTLYHHIKIMLLAILKFFTSETFQLSAYIRKGFSQIFNEGLSEKLNFHIKKISLLFSHKQL